MDFHITNRDGPARIGVLTIEKKKVCTPNILYLFTSRCITPGFSDILITDTSIKTKKPVLRINPSLLSTQKNKQFGIVPSEKDFRATTVNYDAGIVLISNATQLVSHQSLAVDLITKIRISAGYEKLIYLPGVGDPTTIALFTYMGVDLFDSFSAVMAARNNMLLFPTGAAKKDDLSELACSCPVCMKAHDASAMKYNDILQHNYHMLSSEIKQVRNAIRSGSLRELVEIRVRAHPHLASLLRLLDVNQYPFMEERTPLIRKHPLLATTKDALVRPEIHRFQERVLSRYEKPKSADVLLLLPCSAKKPYSFSKSHKLFRERIMALSNPGVVHEVIVTSPIGLVPRELELTYPASSYDIAVTGHWDEDEKKIIRSLLRRYLEKNHYSAVIMHLPAALQDFIADVVPEPISTCKNSPTSAESLDALSEGLNTTTLKRNKVSSSQRAYENITALALYQFGAPLTESLLKEANITGKYPYQKIIHHNRQLGMVTEERGLISLTLEGAERLADAPHYWVEIYGDFPLIGSVFAPGIKDADESIRVGDEVIIRKQKNICGVGVALMNGKEMNEVTHGEAVKIRHHR